MRAERVRSVRSSAVAAAEGPFERRSCRSYRSSRSACMTERSVRAYGAVGATRAGRSRVRCVDSPRFGEIGEIGRDWGDWVDWESAQDSSEICRGRDPIGPQVFRFLEFLRFGKFQGNFKTRLMKFGGVSYSLECHATLLVLNASRENTILPNFMSLVLKLPPPKLPAPTRPPNSSRSCVRRTADKLS